MLRTFVRLLQVNPGFDATHVLTFRVSVASVKYHTDDAAVQFFRKLKENLSQLPSVEAPESFPICRSTTHFRTGTASIGGRRLET